ncbi:unnamed protein product [Darwinula stevensoni]|uniref:Uncharacterized protein n=1 Tax=Darwinula stevensoni TaxID=69355 RepID=A0A7R9A2Y0_9CRUS|nr:unnamed protein product [Darwinula stevensoni]CAG0890636.1 unnamed protein product [Darwinula stevensoni]
MKWVRAQDNSIVSDEDESRCETRGRSKISLHLTNSKPSRCNHERERQIGLVLTDSHCQITSFIWEEGRRSSHSGFGITARLLEDTKIQLGKREVSDMKVVFALLILGVAVYAEQPPEPCCCDPRDGCDPDGCFDACLNGLPETTGICFEPPYNCWCFDFGCTNALADKANFFKGFKAKRI